MLLRGCAIAAGSPTLAPGACAAAGSVQGDSTKGLAQSEGAAPPVVSWTLDAKARDSCSTLRGAASVALLAQPGGGAAVAAAFEPVHAQAGGGAAEVATFEPVHAQDDGTKPAAASVPREGTTSPPSLLDTLGAQAGWR
eukprot:4069547-Prymnesium_polylepis.1